MANSGGVTGQQKHAAQRVLDRKHDGFFNESDVGCKSESAQSCPYEKEKRVRYNYPLPRMLRPIQNPDDLVSRAEN